MSTILWQDITNGALDRYSQAAVAERFAAVIESCISERAA